MIRFVDLEVMEAGRIVTHSVNTAQCLAIAEDQVIPGRNRTCRLYLRDRIQPFIVIGLRSTIEEKIRRHS